MIFYIRITLRLSTYVKLYLQKFCIAEKLFALLAAAILKKQKKQYRITQYSKTLDLRYANDA